MKKNDIGSAVSRQTLERLPYYLELLHRLHREGLENVSAPRLARALGLGEVQVRKDLAAVAMTAGRPKTGYQSAELIRDIEEFLGYNNTTEAVLVGVGHLGKALLSYEGFQRYGMKIIAAFDTDESLIGREVAGKPVLPLEKLEPLCRRMNLRIGIITVPAEAAQDVCGRLVAGGVQAIWNFSPMHLEVPDGVYLKNENMAASLALLSQHLAKRDREEAAQEGLQ